VDRENRVSGGRLQKRKKGLTEEAPKGGETDSGKNQ